MTSNMIDYQKLADSVKFYEDIGFKKIETPWRVSEEIMEITNPNKTVSNFNCMKGDSNKCVVASGEQSFLYLYHKGYLSDGKYQTITPCFRDDSIDPLHVKEFMKNELIILNPKDPEKELDELIKNALNFFYKYISVDGVLTLVETTPVNAKKNLDIVYGPDIEIGSYGIRKYYNLTWIYGTGIAEPRFTRVLGV